MYQTCLIYSLLSIEQWGFKVHSSLHLIKIAWLEDIKHDSSSYLDDPIIRLLGFFPNESTYWDRKIARFG